MSIVVHVRTLVVVVVVVVGVTVLGYRGWRLGVLSPAFRVSHDSVGDDDNDDDDERPEICGT